MKRFRRQMLRNCASVCLNCVIRRPSFRPLLLRTATSCCSRICILKPKKRMLRSSTTFTSFFVLCAYSSLCCVVVSCYSLLRTLDAVFLVVKLDEVYLKVILRYLWGPGITHADCENWDLETGSSWMTRSTSESMFYPLTMCTLQIVFMIMIMLR